MAEFTSDVMESTQEQDDTEYKKFQDLLAKQTAAAQKQFAGKYETPVSAPVSLADQLRAKTTYTTGEYGRREQAAQNKYNLAQTLDTRRGSVANRVRSALFGREQTQQESMDKFSQAARSAQMKAAQQNQQFQTAVGKMNFYSYKSEADRVDAMHDAYRKGVLDYQMIDAARNNMLKTADIDKYFSVLVNDLENKYREIVALDELKQKAFIADYEAASRNAGNILSGVFDIAAAAIKSQGTS
jgi:hypothetical protein